MAQVRRDQKNGFGSFRQFLQTLFNARFNTSPANGDLLGILGCGLITGLAIQQAMSHGLPVIVARGDGTQEDLVRPGSGWLIPPDDQQGLNATLAEALSDHARLRRMGAESYRITAEEINLEQMTAAFVRAVNAVKSLTQQSK